MLKAVQSGALRADGWQPFYSDTEGWMADRSVGDTLLDRSGTDLGLALAARSGKRRALKLITEVVDGDKSVSGLR